MSDSTTPLSHPEWEKENSLTCPDDRDRNNKWKPNQFTPVLEGDELNEAIKTTAFTDKFRREDRLYSDPGIFNQNIGLFSFVPAKNAVPNKNGVYGFIKLRGNFNSPVEANQKAEELIRHVDSYHQIYHCYVGKPCPITINSNYSADIKEIDIRKEVTEAISTSIKSKKVEEQRTIAEIKQREENLLAESKREEVDPQDEYITLRVKLAQLSFTYLEHQKKLGEIRDIIIKTRKEIDVKNVEYPEFAGMYYDKYMKARQDAGIKEDAKESESK
jgi:hypothetical protein